MRFFGCFAIAMIGGSAAIAQPMTTGRCQMMLDAAQPVLDTVFGPSDTGQRIALSGDWCQIENWGTSGATAGAGVTADALRWRGGSVAGTIDGFSFPDKLEVNILRLQRASSDAKNTLRTQRDTPPVDISFAAEWSARDKTIKLNTASARFANGEYVIVNGLIEGIDISSEAALKDSGASAAVKKASLTARNQSGAVFDLLGQLPISDLILGQATGVGDRADAVRQKLDGLLSKLPLGVFPATSRTAMKSLIRDMPNPKGTVQVDLNFDSGLRLQPFERLGPSEALKVILSILRDAKVTATYDRLSG